MGLQQEHLHWGEAAAGGGGGRKAQQCFEPGRFLSNLAQVSLEEVNKLLVRIFSGVLQLLSQEHPSGSSALVSTAAPLVWPAQAPPALGEAGEQQRVMGTDGVSSRGSWGQPVCLASSTLGWGRQPLSPVPTCAEPSALGKGF